MALNGCSNAVSTVKKKTDQFNELVLGCHSLTF